ncbi:MAG: hypothetical protein KJ993_13965 [Actinobacteria bacterium]|nr:hypothetical protein [Actinomycetota bacterium]
MDDKEKTIEQCKLAFDFIQKLYHEVSYLIKEVEGSLGREQEEFVIGKTSGYGIVTKSSTGLDPGGVNWWLRRKMSVFFVPKTATRDRSTTSTDIDGDLKVVYLRIVLDEDSRDFEPVIYSGVISNIKNLQGGAKLSKFENYPYHFELNEQKIFTGREKFHYEDSYISFDAKLRQVHLFDLSNSDAIMREIVEPALNLYRAQS